MTPHFCPGAYWFHLPTETEHMILSIDEEDVVTISPPEPWKLPDRDLLETPVASWHGDHEAFFEEFTPPSSAEID